MEIMLVLNAEPPQRLNCAGWQRGTAARRGPDGSAAGPAVSACLHQCLPATMSASEQRGHLPAVGRQLCACASVLAACWLRAGPKRPSIPNLAPSEAILRSCLRHMRGPWLRHLGHHDVPCRGPLLV